MTRQEHLLVHLMEECNELSQRASKALRFGINEVQPGQELTNADRIRCEYADLIGTYDKLILDDALRLPSHDLINDKMVKIEKYLEYAKECGTLT